MGPFKVTFVNAVRDTFIFVQLKFPSLGVLQQPESGLVWSGLLLERLQEGKPAEAGQWIKWSLAVCTDGSLQYYAPGVELRFAQ